MTEIMFNAQDNPTTEEQEILAALCVWENNMKGADFFALNKMFYHLVAHCCEVSAQKNHR